MEFGSLVVGLYVIHSARYVTWEARLVGFPRVGPDADAADRLAVEIGRREADALDALAALLELRSVVAQGARPLARRRSRARGRLAGLERGYAGMGGAKC